MTLLASSYVGSLAKLINSCTFSHLVAHSGSLCFRYSSYFTKSTKRRIRSAGGVPCRLNNMVSLSNDEKKTEKLTSSSSFRKIRTGSMKAFSFLFTGGLTSGMFPSYMRSTTDSGERPSLAAFASISESVCRSMSVTRNEGEATSKDNLLSDSSAGGIDGP